MELISVCRRSGCLSFPPRWVFVFSVPFSTAATVPYSPTQLFLPPAEYMNSVVPFSPIFFRCSVSPSFARFTFCKFLFLRGCLTEAPFFFQCFLVPPVFRFPRDRLYFPFFIPSHIFSLFDLSSGCLPVLPPVVFCFFLPTPSSFHPEFLRSARFARSSPTDPFLRCLRTSPSLCFWRRHDPFLGLLSSKPAPLSQWIQARTMKCSEFRCS